ncbi:hypothetical protein ABKN59_006683 [Abortiporus biennis]
MRALKVKIRSHGRRHAYIVLTDSKISTEPAIYSKVHLAIVCAPSSYTPPGTRKNLSLNLVLLTISSTASDYRRGTF